VPATLVTIVGPLKGQVFALVEDSIGIGRDTLNDIVIGDASVSRRHSVLRREQDGFYSIVDLESLNGTHVNGVPVGERRLENGDQIQIGSSLFLLCLESSGLVHGKEDTRLSSAQAATVETSPMTPLQIEDAFFLDAKRRDNSMIPAPEIERGLDFLLHATHSLHAARTLDDWTERLVALTLDAAPAVTAAAVALTDETGQPCDAAGRSRKAIRVRPMSIDRVAAEQAMTSKTALLGGSSRNGDAFAFSSVIAPLMASDQALGVLHAEAETGLSDLHAHLMAALASIAAGALENVRHIEWLEGERRRIEQDWRLEHEMIGESPAMRRVFEFIAKVAPSDATALILGESGTGKELVARAIHWNSSRAKRPFVAVNCAALAETLLESDLFGHERGAFTGAFARKIGRIEIADGGTLFLDEVGDLASALQAKLLRVVETRQFERLGGTRPLRVDVRIVAATNRDLERDVKSGAFRADLFYRLNVVSVHVPPLRERRSDIPLLASYFASHATRRARRRLTGISPEARACLMRYDWPGNARELQNAVERAVLLGAGDLIRPEDLPEALLETNAATPDAAGRYHDAVAQAKRRLILEAVEHAQGNVSEAARSLGLHPNYLHRLMRHLGLKERDRA
jgi:transcriptional regulator with GAF, ATPase, and Fis domain/pSer/pThr/pTyr-binding forkhead associated (FHA) protein